MTSTGDAAGTPPGAVTAAAVVSTPELADQIADAARAVPGVAELHGGLFGEAATYLPGRRLIGVRLGPGGTEVHVRAEFDARLPDLADRVRRAVEAVPGVTRPVDIEIADIDDGRPDPDPADRGPRTDPVERSERSEP